MKTAAWMSSIAAGLLLLALPASTALEYTPDASGATLNLEDEATRIAEIRTIFIGDTTLVTLEGIDWSPVESDSNATSSKNLVWETSVNGVVQASGVIGLSDVGRELPTSIDAGSIVVDKSK
jgi:hypothetical protein